MTLQPLGCLAAAGLFLLGSLGGCEQEPPPFEMQPLARPPDARPGPPPAAPDAGAPARPLPAEAPGPEDGPLPTGEEPVPEGAVRLAWRVPEAGALAFRAGLERFAGDGLPIPIPDLAEKGELPPETARRLAGYRPAGTAPQVLVLLPNPGGTFTARMYGQEARAVRDPNVAKLMQAETHVLFKGALDEHGSVLAYELSSLQRLALGLFFGLPARPVRPGDTWAAEVNLLGLDEGFTVSKSRRWNQVRLVSLAPLADGEQLAVLEYRLGAFEEGTGLDAEERPQPATRGAAFLGRAEFLVKRGTWRVFAGHLVSRLTGPERVEQHRALVLTPLDALPREISQDSP